MVATITLQMALALDELDRLGEVFTNPPPNKKGVRGDIGWVELPTRPSEARERVSIFTMKALARAGIVSIDKDTEGRGYRGRLVAQRYYAWAQDKTNKLLGKKLDHPQEGFRVWVLDLLVDPAEESVKIAK